jgi:hypothetical protein
MPDAEWCVNHDPPRVVQLAEWRKKGGEGRSNRARARKSLAGDGLTPGQLQAVISKALTDVLSGELEPGRANAAAALSRSLITIKEAVDVDVRLAELERRLGSRSA